ncbi:hypothetical protein [Alishewanella phage vB_AspM_Slickus01]|nr:hypothetical protein [Alishewanella phage vB_AspM_Slickus01]
MLNIFKTKKIRTATPFNDDIGYGYGEFFILQVKETGLFRKDKISRDYELAIYKTQCKRLVDIWITHGAELMNEVIANEIRNCNNLSLSEVIVKIGEYDNIENISQYLKQVSRKILKEIISFKLESNAYTATIYNSGEQSAYIQTNNFSIKLKIFRCLETMQITQVILDNIRFKDDDVLNELFDHLNKNEKAYLARFLIKNMEDATTVNKENKKIELFQKITQ